MHFGQVVELPHACAICGELRVEHSGIERLEQMAVTAQLRVARAFDEGESVRARCGSLWLADRR